MPTYGRVLGSGVASCAVCGHPYPPEQLRVRRDLKLVCRFHDFWPDREESQYDIALLRTYYRRNYVHIQGHIPIDADGNPFIPGGTTPPVDPGGGSGGGPGTEEPPGEEPPSTDPNANYVDGSCD